MLVQHQMTTGTAHGGRAQTIYAAAPYIVARAIPAAATTAPLDVQLQARLRHPVHSARNVLRTGLASPENQTKQHS
jgi:hypothetical protein